MKQAKIDVGIMISERVSFQLLGKFQNTFAKENSQFSAIVQENLILLKDDAGNSILQESFIFEPADDKSIFELYDVSIGIDFHWEQKKNFCYQSSLILKIENGQIRVINRLPLEEYLRSVISSEMNANSSIEFLKAHAVISRSWLMAQVLKNEELKEDTYTSIIETEDEYIRWYDREDHMGFDVCADDHCQRYQGINEVISEKVDQVIAETYGEFLVYDNKICDARFSKCCGGVSESFHTVWEPVEHKYLAPVADMPDNSDFPDLRVEENAIKFIHSQPQAFCNTQDQEVLSQVLPDFDQTTTDFYRWTKTYSQAELSALIHQRSGVDYGDILALEPIERAFSGRIIRLRIRGSKQTKIIGKELEIRRTLSDSHLYSSAFTVEAKDVQNGIPQQFKICGAGWGHGVGLCQIGAAVMGEQGYSYKEILLHYFKAAELQKLY